MTETKELLRAAIGTADPQVPDLEVILGRMRDRRRRERVVAAFVALALTAGLAVGLASLLRAGSGGQPSDGVTVVGPTRVVLIPSVSMKPTLREGDSVLVTRAPIAPRAGSLAVVT